MLLSFAHCYVIMFSKHASHHPSLTILISGFTCTVALYETIHPSHSAVNVNDYFAGRSVVSVNATGTSTRSVRHNRRRLNAAATNSIRTLNCWVSRSGVCGTITESRNTIRLAHKSDTIATRITIIVHVTCRRPEHGRHTQHDEHFGERRRARLAGVAAARLGELRIRMGAARTQSQEGESESANR